MGTPTLFKGGGIFYKNEGISKNVLNAYCIMSLSIPDYYPCSIMWAFKSVCSVGAAFFTSLKVAIFEI